MLCSLVVAGERVTGITTQVRVGCRCMAWLRVPPVRETARALKFDAHATPHDNGETEQMARTPNNDLYMFVRQTTIEGLCEKQHGGRAINRTGGGTITLFSVKSKCLKEIQIF